MNNVLMIGLAVSIAMMASGVNAQEAKTLPSALDELAAAVGKQIESAGKELKSFLKKTEEEAIEQAINRGIKRITVSVDATPQQAAEIKPILRKDVETTGEILDEALAVGMAAARVSLTRSMAREWKNVRTELSETLSDEQLAKADKLHAELVAELLKVFKQRLPN